MSQESIKKLKFLVFKLLQAYTVFILLSKLCSSVKTFKKQTYDFFKQVISIYDFYINSIKTFVKLCLK